MNWKEISCPQCKEKMQAPLDRNRIICMFCGQQISLNGDKAIPPFYPEGFPAQIKEVLSAHETYLARFSAEEYPEAFFEFCERFSPCLEQIKRGIGQQQVVFMTESILEQASCFIRENKSGNRSGQLQYRLNSYVAVYLIPAIIHIAGEEAHTFCTGLGSKWAAAFPQSQIKVGEYETIVNGFKRKLCYITTAACQALDKGEDCREIRRLKDYRDNYLMRQPGGADLIREYYNLAPTIVKRMEKSAKKKELYLDIWTAYLLPCLQDLDQGKQKACGDRYREMMNELTRRYVENWNK